MIVGNSSSGVREAPVYGIPAINIGSRQNNRCHHESIINVNIDRDSISDAIRIVLDGQKKYKKSSIFGNGDSAKKFLEILSYDEFWDVNVQKVFGLDN